MPSPRPDARPVHRVGIYAPVLLIAAFLLALAAGCGGEAGAPPAAESPAAESLRPRISAEHPVTSPPAREAGLLEDGALDGGGEVETVEQRTVWLVLPATDLEESLDFYRGLLAFEVTATEPAEPPFDRVELVPPALPRGRLPLRLVLVPAAELEAAAFPAPAGAGAGADDGESDETGEGEAGEGRSGFAGALPAWPVADLAAVARLLEEAGVETVERSTPPGRRGLAVVDPAGNRLLLLEPGDA